MVLFINLNLIEEINVCNSAFLTLSYTFLHLNMIKEIKMYDGDLLHIDIIEELNGHFHTIKYD